MSISTDSSLKRKCKTFRRHSSLNNNNDLPASSQSLDNTPQLSSLDSEHNSGYVKQMTNGNTNATSSSTNISSVEPFYVNARKDAYKRFTNHNYNAFDDDLTHHSTNILIRYHDSNSPSSSPSHFKAPTPIPRSSIISTYHCKDTSTHIVQSYGPAYANSHIINSSKSNSTQPSNRPSSCINDSYSTDSMKNTSQYLYNVYNNESNRSFSLPRTSVTKPKTRNSSSQTREQTDNENLHLKNFKPNSQHTRITNDNYVGNRQNSETKTLNKHSLVNNRSYASCHDADKHRDGIHNSPTNTQWKNYNWDSGQNRDTWCKTINDKNSLQDSHINQVSWLYFFSFQPVARWVSELTQ